MILILRYCQPSTHDNTIASIHHHTEDPERSISELRERSTKPSSLWFTYPVFPSALPPHHRYPVNQRLLQYLSRKQQDAIDEAQGR